MKIGLCLTERAAEARRVASAMIEAQRGDAPAESRVLDFGLGALALLGHPDEAVGDWPFVQRADGSFLAVAGAPIVSSNGGTRGKLHNGSPLMRAFSSGAKADAMRAFLRDVDGVFLALYWDAEATELTVVTDILGLQPLYEAETPSGICLASAMRAFTQAGVVPITPHAGAWGASLLFGNQVGPQSLLQSVTRVAAATMLVFGKHAVRRTENTWTFKEGARLRDDAALREALAIETRADVAAHATVAPDAALLMSGGFDSRMILATCLEQGIRPRLIVQSHPDENADADARFAMAIARQLGVPATRRHASEDFFGGNSYLWFLERNEVTTPSYQLFIATVVDAVRGERRGVWDGLLLGPALKFHLTSNFGSFLSQLASNRKFYRDAVQTIFSPAWAERLRAEYDELLATERARFDDTADGLWRFNLGTRIRFRIGPNPHQVYDSVTPALTPGSSRALWDIASRIDTNARVNKQLNYSVLQHLAPHVMRTPIVSGSSLIRGTAGAWLYHTQVMRSAVQRVTRRPRVRSALTAAGIRPPFEFRRSRFLDVALGEVNLDDAHLNADGIRALRAGGASSSTRDTALEVLLYWRAWHRVMRGDLRSAWGGNPSL